MRKLLIVLIVLILTLSSVLAACKNQEPTLRARLITSSDPVDISAFSRADKPRQLIFPKDHGPHPDYQTEWWYYTGNLFDSDNRHFGYQLTFFRRSILPPGQIHQRGSNLATDQVYMAHFAITDPVNNDHTAFERLRRGSAGLAGTQANPFRVWLDDWRVQEITPGKFHLQAAEEDIIIDLEITDAEGVLLQGDQGYSPKGSSPGQASYYYSYPRLHSEGIIHSDGEDYHVSGWSWMDHEFSTSALARDQAGWEWISLQLSDNSELMLFQIRRLDGQIDPVSSGVYLGSSQERIPLNSMDFSLVPSQTWVSPETGINYPIGWDLSIPAIQLNIRIEPVMEDQEMNLSYQYWEGAVIVRGKISGEDVEGYGYLELTGYGSPFGGEF